MAVVRSSVLSGVGKEDAAEATSRFDSREPLLSSRHTIFIFRRLAPRASNKTELTTHP